MINTTRGHPHQFMAYDGDEARATRDQLDTQLRGDGDGSRGSGGTTAAGEGAGTGGEGVASNASGRRIQITQALTNSGKGTARVVSPLQERSDERRQIDAAGDALRSVCILDYEDLNAKTRGSARESLKMIAAFVRVMDNRQHAIEEETKRRRAQPQGNTPAKSWTSDSTRVSSLASSWVNGNPFIRPSTSTLLDVHWTPCGNRGVRTCDKPAPSPAATGNGNRPC